MTADAVATAAAPAGYSDPPLAESSAAKPGVSGTVETIDDWGLPMEFHLFARHEYRTVWLPTKEGGDGEAEDPASLLRLECVEALTPLDMLGLSSGSHDATGHCVWLGAFYLVALLGDRTDLVLSNVFGGRRVVELGCGTGIGGLALLKSWHCRPSHVCFTDADPDVLQLCERNCRINFPPDDSNGAIAARGVVAELDVGAELADWSVAALRWGEDPLPDPVATRGPFDAVLATDVVYDLGVLPALLSTAVACLSERGGHVVVSHVPRACRTALHSGTDSLEDVLVAQAAGAGLELERLVRPPSPEKASSSFPAARAPSGALNADVSMQRLREAGAALFVFAKKENNAASAAPFSTSRGPE